ncbi:MAG: uncharacterized protein QOG66_688 [Methylobacteriaceae bacterium]|jgi:uncharacterized protein|nr:uncharacterized protein [Methylobacteriaceae bacterium]
MIPGAVSRKQSTPAGTARAEPLGPGERIDAIDALRGLALFGVLIINVVTEFRVSIFEQFLVHPPIRAAFDATLHTLLMLLVSQKALSLFSLLFGLGLAIQFDRLRDNPQRLKLLLRRLAVLLAIGLVHLCLIWNGDILTEYALAGFIVLPFLYGPRWIVAAAGAAVFALYLVMPFLPPLVAFPSQAWIAQHAAEATRAYGQGGFAEVFAFRLHEIPAILVLHVLIFPRTIALMLVGAFLWRTGILSRIEAHTLLFGALAVPVIILGLGLGALVEGLTPLNRSFLGQGLFSIERFAPPMLAIGYGAAVLAIIAAGGGRLFAWAAPLGRMAFTNYLLQSLIFGGMFYGYGLGLFGALGIASALALGGTVYVIQVVLSRWWLRRFRFGPVEWLWRTLMYGMVQPMRMRPRPVSG